MENIFPVALRVIAPVPFARAYDPAWSRRKALEGNFPLRAFSSDATSAATGKNRHDPLRIDATHNVMASLHPSEGGFGVHMREIGAATGHFRFDIFRFQCHTRYCHQCRRRISPEYFRQTASESERDSFAAVSSSLTMFHTFRIVSRKIFQNTSPQLLNLYA